MGIDDLKLLKEGKEPIDAYMNQETHNIYYYQSLNIYFILKVIYIFQY